MIQRTVKQIIAIILLLGIMISTDVTIKANETKDLKTQCENIENQIKVGTIQSINKSQVPKDVQVIKTNTVEEYEKVLKDLSNETLQDTEENENMSNKSRSSSYPMNVTKTYTTNGGTFKIVERAIIKIKNKQGDLQIKSTAINLTGFTYSLKIVGKQWDNTVKKKVASIKCHFNIRHYITTPFGEIKMYDNPHTQSFKYSKDKGIFNKVLK